MKFNLKTLAAAVALASLAGGASAAFTSGSTVTNGTVSLVAWNVVTQDWYVRDLGLLMNDFLPSNVTTLAGDGGATGNKTPEAGIVVDKTVQANFADSAFSTWFATQNSADVRWMVGSYDQTSASPTTQRRLIATSTSNTQTFLNSALDSFVSTSNYGGMSAFFNASTGNQSAVSNWSTVTNIVGTYTSAFASGVATALVGGSQNLYYSVRSAFTGSSTSLASAQQYGNSQNNAVVSLATNGDLTYSLAPAAVAAVPVPASLWLLGAGLAGIGGMVRRRKAAAQA